MPDPRLPLPRLAARPLAWAAMAAFRLPAPAHLPAPARLLVGLALAASLATPVLASDESEPLDLVIAAQPLGDALNELAALAGMPVAFAQPLVSGRQAAAVAGKLTPREALDRLLTGSGLVAHKEGRTWVIRSASAPAPESTLPSVQVTASAERDGTSEHSDSYRTGYSDSATRLSLSLRETPQTVAVVTRQQMDDFGMSTVNEALKASTGVVAVDRSIQGSTYFSRGFQLQSQYDGLPNPLGIGNVNSLALVDNAFLDRVEVLQGASGLLAGAGYPGGTINLIRKQPTRTYQAQAEVQLGSWNQRRLVGDLSGPVAFDGRLSARLVAVADDRDSFVDYVKNQRRSIYGAVSADLTTSTTVTANLHYQEDKGRDHYGVPFASDGGDAGLSRSSFFNDAKQRYDRNYRFATLGLVQRLPADWTLRAGYSDGKGRLDYRHSGYILGDGVDRASGEGLTFYQGGGVRNRTRSRSYDLHVTGPFTWLGRRHELVVGLNGSELDHDQREGSSVPMDINAYAFDPGALPEQVEGDFNWFRHYKTRQLGGYGVARLALTGQLKAIIGTRVSNYRSTNLRTGVEEARKNGQVSPYAGLIYDINETSSAYLSYSDIFNPQSVRNATGSVLKPVVGANYELGIKAELLERRLNLSAALFRLEQSNLAQVDRSVDYDTTNACGGFCYSAAGRVLSQGLDLNLSGEIRPGWSVSAGYVYVDSEYAAGADQGKRYGTYLPRHSLRLLTHHEIPATAWAVGASAQVYSRIYTAGTTADTGLDYTMARGTLTLLGLSARYRLNARADITVAVRNLTDRTYRTAVDSLSFAPYGEPRSVLVSLKYRL